MEKAAPAAFCAWNAERQAQGITLQAVIMGIADTLIGDRNPVEHRSRGRDVRAHLEGRPGLRVPGLRMVQMHLRRVRIERISNARWYGMTLPYSCLF